MMLTAVAARLPSPASNDCAQPCPGYDAMTGNRYEQTGRVATGRSHPRQVSVRRCRDAGTPRPRRSHILATLSQHDREDLIFFGGTALSRTYLVIERLSEDIDLIAIVPRKVDQLTLTPFSGHSPRSRTSAMILPAAFRPM
jgi:hypothetical protein